MAWALGGIESNYEESKRVGLSSTGCDVREAVAALILNKERKEVQEKRGCFYDRMSWRLQRCIPGYAIDGAFRE